VIYSRGWKPGLAVDLSSISSHFVVICFKGPQAPAIVSSVLTTVSLAVGTLSRIFCDFAGPRASNFQGMVALQPVPTISPAATRELGNDLTEYASEQSVAMVSLVIAAIRS